MVQNELTLGYKMRSHLNYLLSMSGLFCFCFVLFCFFPSQFAAPDVLQRSYRKFLQKVVWAEATTSTFVDRQEFKIYLWDELMKHCWASGWVWEQFLSWIVLIVCLCVLRRGLLDFFYSVFSSFQLPLHQAEWWIFRKSGNHREGRKEIMFISGATM